MSDRTAVRRLGDLAIACASSAGRRRRMRAVASASTRKRAHDSGKLRPNPSRGRCQRMSAPPSPPGAHRTDGSSVRIGALVPLTRPGWVEAGQHLLAGLELAVGEVNDAGGIVGRPLELVVRDTAADPQRAAAAVDELAGASSGLARCPLWTTSERRRWSSARYRLARRATVPRGARRLPPVPRSSSAATRHEAPPRPVERPSKAPRGVLITDAPCEICRCETTMNRSD